MFLKCITNRQGIKHLYFYKSIYLPDKKKTTQKLVKHLGRLEDLEKQYPDPIAHFKEEASRLTELENIKRYMNSPPIDLELKILDNVKEEMDEGKNVGYVVLKKIYKLLELDVFWRRMLKKHKRAKINLDQIFRLLVFSRIMYPGSKKSDFEKKARFFENTEDKFTLDQTYRALDFICEHKKEMEAWIFEKSAKLCCRKLSTIYFDCTNYYFDIGAPDLDILNDDGLPIDKDGKLTDVKYRKRGPEKNRRPDPIVGMGLLMDSNEIPIAYDLFPGNESEKLHMRPIIKRAKAMSNTARIIVVTDRGLNTSDNIYYLNGDNKTENNKFDGYVYGQTVRGADEEFKQWVLSKDDKNKYIYSRLTRDKAGFDDENPVNVKDAQDSICFIHKSRIASKKLMVNIPNTNKKKCVMVDQKQMVYYSAKYARKQRIQRENMIQRAKDLIANPQKYNRVTASGSAGYIKNISFNKNTGEIVKGRSLSLDLEKIAEEEKYDGFYAIVTSELNMSDEEMRRIYRGLSRIEDAFKISKTDLRSRPIYVATNEHIEGHFAVCFTSLVFIRLLYVLLNHQFPVARIIESLRKYQCVQQNDSVWHFTYFNQVLGACESALDMDLNVKYRTQEGMRRLLIY